MRASDTEHDGGKGVAELEAVDDVGHGNEEKRLGHEIGGATPMATRAAPGKRMRANG